MALRQALLQSALPDVLRRLDLSLPRSLSLPRHPRAAAPYLSAAAAVVLAAMALALALALVRTRASARSKRLLGGGSRRREEEEEEVAAGAFRVTCRPAARASCAAVGPEDAGAAAASAKEAAAAADEVRQSGRRWANVRQASVSAKEEGTECPADESPKLRGPDSYVSAANQVISARRVVGQSQQRPAPKKNQILRKELSDDAFRQRLDEAKEEGRERLRVVCAAPLELRRSYRAPVHAKTREETDFLSGCLGESFLFEKLGSEERRTLIDAFEKCSVESGRTIVEEGEICSYFYVIQTGEVKYGVDETKEGKAGRGDVFGVFSLLYNCPHQSVTALAACELWRVDQFTFRRITATYQIKGDADTKELLKKVEFLKDLDDQTLTEIVHAMGTRDFKAGEQIVRKGERASCFILVKSGKLKATDIERGGEKLDDRELGPGDHVSPSVVLQGLEAFINLVAVEDTTVLYLERSHFIRACGGYDELIKKAANKKVLQMMPIAGRRLDESAAGQLASIAKGVECKSGHVFYREGDDIWPSIYIIQSGEVKVEGSDGSTKTLGLHCLFGTETVSEANEGTVTARYTVTATRDASLVYLCAHSITSVLGATSLRDEIEMEDLERHHIIGAGTFGRVWLVNRKGTEDAYALKIQFKRKLIDDNQAAGVIREKNIMAKLSSDFVINLVNAYQDDQNVYMLMKLYQGGELWAIMHGEDYDALPECVAMFYAGGVLEGLTHMHRHCVLYRDLKPENVLLDSDGYTVIVDLGCAKVVPDKTYTFCGTPAYLAPEVILQRGHDKGADHWSWGVMLYEMICGITPFYDKGIDQLTLFKRIIHENFQFPDDDTISEDIQDLIRSVLVADPKNRLGSFAGAEMDIQEHAWFGELNFEKLYKKELTPPWQPEITDPLDVSNFDNWDHQKDKKQKGKPLSAGEQLLFKDFSKFICS